MTTPPTQEDQPIYNFEWVLTREFDINKLSFDSVPINKTTRVRFLYKYNDDEEPKEFHLTIPLKEEAFFLFKGFKKDPIPKAPTSIVKRYSSPFIIEKNNEDHVAFYEVLIQILNKFGKHIKKDPSISVVDKDKSIYLYSNLIQSTDVVYTPFYTKEEKLNFTLLNSFIGRPAFSFSGNTETGKVSLQLHQAYVHKLVKNFPLAYRE